MRVTIIIDDCDQSGSHKPPKPGLMYAIRRGERLMGKINVVDYDVALPAKSAEDVVKRHLKITGTGPGDAILQADYDIDTPLGEAGPASQTITVLDALVGISLELRDEDNAGNIGDPSVFNFDSSDTVAPPAPGELGVTRGAERVIDGA